MNKIEEAKIHLQALRPRSQRRVVLERKLVHLMVKQLKSENRIDRRAVKSQAGNITAWG